MIPGHKSYLRMKNPEIEWLGVVPEHWRVLPNRAIFSEVNDQGHAKEQMLAVTISKGVIPQQVLLKDSSKKDSSRLDRSGYKLVQPEDIAYNKMRAWQGALGVSDYRGIISPAYVVQRPRTNALARYLHYLFRTPAFAKEAERWSYGITSDMWSLRPEHFKMIYSCIPPLPEQTAIARFLDHMDRRIQKYIRGKEKLIALLDEYKQALIHQAVTGQINVRTGAPYSEYKESGVEWIGKMPSHWQRARLKALIQPIDIRSVDGKETLLSLRRDHGIVVYAEHFSRPPQGASLVGYKLVKPGHLVVNRLQANNGLIFCSALSGVVSPDYSVFEQRSEVQVRFLSELLRTRLFRTHFRKQATGLGTGTAGFLRLYDNDFLATPFCLPPLSEQTRIVAYIDHVVSQTKTATERTSRSIGFFREYRTRLIADVVTGKLDVREAAAELPDMNATACGNGIDTMQAESNSHEPERGIAEEANP